jgi:hypothetical protein
MTHISQFAETKNQWARDDPAFLALLMVFLLISSVAYTIAFRVSALSFFRLVAGTVLLDFLGFGVFVATVTWFAAEPVVYTL